MKPLNVRVLELIHQKGVSSAFLANALDLNLSYLTGFLEGRRGIGALELAQILTMLDVDPDQFFGLPEHA